jgi:hypothetical protein
MRELQRHHIVDIYVWIDDSLPTQQRPLGGRPSVLRDNELLTILIWGGLNEPHKNLSAVYSWIARDYSDYFPRSVKGYFVHYVRTLLGYQMGMVS